MSAGAMIGVEKCFPLDFGNRQQKAYRCYLNQLRKEVRREGAVAVRSQGRNNIHTGQLGERKLCTGTRFRQSCVKSYSDFHCL